MPSTNQPGPPTASGAPAPQSAASDVATSAARDKRPDRGAVTAELAITLPVLFSLLLLGIWSIGLVILNIQCIDAARDVARAVARGETPDQAKAIGHRTIPTGTITISREGSDIHVTVTATPTHNPPLLSALAPANLTAQATLQSEPTQDETP
ncbi:TadE family type IV pilus minor pilin [Kribbella kalugense]|uniref:TadE-like protein n=1 Tax=Kribbella kalugense TaxID=2512221 RepID=A0A4R7ZN61_9ACTN|nr:TadE family type IV pilus minor pilin [Kribbella kalugense]TDW18746.1 TadE-like protein [Kribbella kalugense]